MFKNLPNGKSRTQLNGYFQKKNLTKPKAIAAMSINEIFAIIYGVIIIHDRTISSSSINVVCSSRTLPESDIATSFTDGNSRVLKQ